jgi:pimeloyl-ACP methyl ester carboxylesterase
MSCYLAECRAILRMFDWLQPFRSRLTFAQPTDPLPDTPTVLLVHGYGCNHAVWLDLAPALADAGYRCEGIDLTPVLGDIDDYAAALLVRMRDLRARTGQPRCWSATAWAGWQPARHR